MFVQAVVDSSKEMFNHLLVFNTSKTFKFIVLFKWWRSSDNYVNAMIEEIDHKIWIDDSCKCLQVELSCLSL